MFGEKKHLITASPATFQSTGTREKHLESKGDQQKWPKGLGNAFVQKAADFGLLRPTSSAKVMLQRTLTSGHLSFNEKIQDLFTWICKVSCTLEGTLLVRHCLLYFWAGVSLHLASKRRLKKKSGGYEPVHLASEGTTLGEYINL